MRTMADMRTGFAVVAAAPGTVLRTRDGEPDRSVDEQAVVDGKDAGNAVVIIGLMAALWFNIDVFHAGQAVGRWLLWICSALMWAGFGFLLFAVIGVELLA